MNNGSNYGSGQHMEKTHRKKREFNIRRAAILAEAEKNFSTRGYHYVTMAEIASASGFSTGALYQFFESKEHLYTTMISEKLAMMYEIIKEKVNSAADLNGKLASLVGAQLQFAEENTYFCRIFLRGENELSAKTINSMQERLINDYFKHLSFIENILKAGVKDGVLRDIPPHDLAAALSFLIRATIMNWLITPSKDRLISKKEMILDIFLNGVKKHDD